MHTMITNVMYITSETQTYDRVLLAARRLVLTIGTGTARLMILPPNLTQRARVDWAETYMVGSPEWKGSGVLVVAGMDELPILRCMRRLRERYDDTPQAFDVSTTFSCKVLPGQKRDLYHLRVQNRGEFLDVWPDGFFGQRVEELF